MTKLPDPNMDPRLQRLGREWFAQVRSQDQADRGATGKSRRKSGTEGGDGDVGWFDGWFSSDCAGGGDGDGGGCGD